MRSLDRRRVRGPIFPAVFLIVLGVIFFLTENHILHGYDIWKLWPLVLIIGGVAKTYNRPSRVEGWLLVAVGLVFLASTFGFLNISPFALWPMALIAAGVLLLWRALVQHDSASAELPKPGADNLIMFGGAEIQFSGQEFEGTAVTVICGGYNLDLRNSTLKGDRAVIDASVMFGGVDLRVPPTWNVVVHGFPMFGGYSDETTHPNAKLDSPQLIVKGSVMFGGVSIKN